MCLAAATAAAQVDTTARDTTALDTAAVLLPAFAPELLPGPLPRGARYVFDGDSLLFSNIYTLSDLLARVPGVYVARGGFFGQAEYVFYAGRGPAALELFWDGVPYLPIGRDSVFLDPARVPLAPVERVEVLPLTGVLRVYLVSRRQASTHATSAVGIVTGDADIARYRGVFARRWRSGAGLSLVGDFNAFPGLSGTSSSRFRDTDIWVQLEYTPSPRVGLSYQILSSSWSRDPDSSGGVDRWEYKRRDGVLRFFVAPRGGTLGSTVQLALVSTSTEGDSAMPVRSTSQVLIDAAQRWPRGHLSVAARLGERRRPLEIEARGSWSPVRRLTLAGEARRSRYVGARYAHRAMVTAGIELILGLSLRGEAVWSDDLQAPLFPADTLQETKDLAWAARLDRSWISLEVGGGRRAGFAPDGTPAGLRPVRGGAFATSPETDYFRIVGAVRPKPWVSIAGWYFDPLSGGGDFEPPHHARVSATFFSRFLRVFPSTINALRAEVAMESWSSWFGYVAEGGAHRPLTGASFVEANVELQIGDVTAFWTMRNMNGVRASYVPELGYPLQLQYFGVRWQFRN